MEELDAGLADDADRLAEEQVFPARDAPAATDAFREAMRSLAGAVSVITVGHGTARTGFTASSVASFSVEPPTLIVSIDKSSSAWPAFKSAGRFCVNILAEGQAAIADRFAGRDGIKGTERFAGADWRETPHGWALAGALVSLDCALEETIERHSHAILIARVEAAALGRLTAPLLYWHRAYRSLSR